MITFKFGKGKGSSFECPFGMPSMKLSEKDTNRSFKTIAKQLAKQLKIENGEVEFESINFSYNRSK
jgi:ABC-type transport system involved in Fe-S cluster assembly fused permease/ATPase subunit